MEDRRGKIHSIAMKMEKSIAVRGPSERGRTDVGCWGESLTTEGIGGTMGV